MKRDIVIELRCQEKGCKKTHRQQVPYDHRDGVSTNPRTYRKFAKQAYGEAQRGAESLGWLARKNVVFCRDHA